MGQTTAMMPQRIRSASIHAATRLAALPIIDPRRISSAVLSPKYSEGLVESVLAILCLLAAFMASYLPVGAG